MKPYILAESHYGTIKELKVDIAVLPWGATEAHNFHLPYGTDNFETGAIAAESARKAWEEGARCLVLPTVPMGVNTGQMDIPYTLNLYPSTQAMILRDILESLENQGIKKLLVLNGHGGNDFKQILRETGVEFGEMLLVTANWFQALNKENYFEHEGDHADEMETSLMMYLHPELVLPLAKAGDGHHRRFSVEALNEKWVWSERKWSRVTKDTGIGDPSLATKEKGERYFRDVTEKIAELIRDLASVDPGDLYR